MPGILVGRGTSILVREFQHWTTEISIPAIVISVAVAGGVGIVLGQVLYGPEFPVGIPGGC